LWFNRKEVVQDYLPAPLSRIRESAVQSVLVSQAVVYQFEHIMNLTTEALKMCTSVKSQQEMNLRKNLDQEKILNINIPSYQQMVANLNETAMKDMAMTDRDEDDMRRALKKYQQAGK
jgi:broad specificity polyphosphatase/5'/3'-nucleotidase SurE